MTYDQFWNDDVNLVMYYRRAAEIKKQKENELLWLQGMYVYDAICKVSPVLHAFAKKGTKVQPYPTEPYALSEKERKQREEAKQIRKFEKFKAMMSTWAVAANQKIKSRGAPTDGNDN